MWHKTDFDFLPIRAFSPRAGRGRFNAGMTLEGGGKGGSVPKPDPKLIAAQVKNLGVQDEMIQQIIRQSNDMLPLQKEQLQFGIESAKKAYEQSQDDRDFMLSRRDKLSGMQDTIVEDAKNFDVGAKRNELADAGRADVQAGFANAESQQARQLARTGVNPNSGKALALGNQTAIAKAAALAGAANMASTKAQDLKYQLTDRASNTLAGYPAMGMQATGAGAAMGGLGMNYANAGLQGMNSGFSQASGMAGQSAQGYGNAWSQQNSAYMADQQAAAAAGAANGQAIGGVTMAGAMMI